MWRFKGINQSPKGKLLFTWSLFYWFSFPDGMKCTLKWFSINKYWLKLILCNDKDIERLTISLVGKNHKITIVWDGTLVDIVADQSHLFFPALMHATIFGNVTALVQRMYGARKSLYQTKVRLNWSNDWNRIKRWIIVVKKAAMAWFHFNLSKMFPPIIHQLF